MHSTTLRAPLINNLSASIEAVKNRIILRIRWYLCPRGAPSSRCQSSDSPDRIGRGSRIGLCSPGGAAQGDLGGVEHEQVHVRGDLEVLPGDGDVFFINSQNPTSGDYQIGDLASLRTHHKVLNAA